MAFREFTDRRGREWRAWEVTPEVISPRTKEEDYLASLYYTGWIVFESKTTDDKRRLYPVPKGWSEMSDPQLEELLENAEVVPARKGRPAEDTPGAEAKPEGNRRDPPRE